MKPRRPCGSRGVYYHSHVPASGF